MPTLKIEPNILYRLVLAKTFYRNAENIIHDSAVNQYSVAQGLLCLHDALDNFLGAVVSKLDIPIKLNKNNPLLDLLDLVKGRSKGSLEKSTEIRQLNTIRNNIKHQGIPPSISLGEALLGPVKEFLDKYCQKYFSVSWETISIADLIKEHAIRQEMKGIEAMIQRGEYKEALNNMGILKFNVFERSNLMMELNGRLDLFSPPSDRVVAAREKPFVFTSDFKGELFSDIYEKIDSIERGIDRNKLSQFELLTAKCGIKNDASQEIVSKHGHNWGTPNWTKQNALFCFNFLIDLILKTQQKEKDYNERIIYEIYDIEIQNSDVIIFKIEKDNKPVKELGKLSLGERYNEVLLLEYRDGAWENFGEPIFISLQNGAKIAGYIYDRDKANIKVTNTHLLTLQEPGV